MTVRNNFKTVLCWQEGDEDREAEVRVFYRGIGGCGATLETPSEPDTVEIDEIRWLAGDKPLPDNAEENASLIDECFADWTEYLQEAAEWRAQSRRDRLMGGF